MKREISAPARVHELKTLLHLGKSWKTVSGELLGDTALFHGTEDRENIWGRATIRAAKWYFGHSGQSRRCRKYFRKFLFSTPVAASLFPCSSLRTTGPLTAI
jgi:hypothetical protein